MDVWPLLRAVLTESAAPPSDPIVRRHDCVPHRARIKG